MEAVADPSTRPIRVLLVDDQTLVRAGFRMVLEAQDGVEVAGEAADGSSGVGMCRTLAPDVVLMDVRMPGTDGIAATRRIVEECPHSRVIVLTTFDLDEYAFAALRAGASGFLLKDVGPAELLTSLRAVAGGEPPFPPGQPPDAGPLQPKASLRSPGPGDEAVASLTRGNGNARGHCAGTHKHRDRGTAAVAESTVKTHVGRILMKLGLRDRVHAVIFAYEHGLASYRRPN